MDAIIKYFADNFTSSPIAFSISLIVLAMSVVIYQLKSMKAIVIGQCVINFFVLLTYIFGGGLSGAAVSVVAIVHTFLIYWLFQRRNKQIPLWFVLLFAAIYIVCTAFTFTDFTDILPIGAAVSFAFSIVQTESWRYRLIVLANPLFWIAYDIVIAAPIPILVTHVIAATAVIVGIIRLDIKRLISKDMRQNMLLQKIYTWYACVSLTLWTAVIVITKINGNIYEIKNQIVFDVVERIAYPALIISFIPILPIMGLIAMITAFRNKKYGCFTFDLLSIPVCACSWFLYMVTVIVSIGGGV